MIQVYKVDMSYKKDIQILRDVSFNVDAGDFVFLVGPSGTGKTTILRILYRELVPTSGDVVVIGKHLIILQLMNKIIVLILVMKVLKFINNLNNNQKKQ